MMEFARRSNAIIGTTTHQQHLAQQHTNNNNNFDFQLLQQQLQQRQQQQNRPGSGGGNNLRYLTGDRSHLAIPPGMFGNNTTEKTNDLNEDQQQFQLKVEEIFRQWIHITPQAQRDPVSAASSIAKLV